MHAADPAQQPGASQREAGDWLSGQNRVFRAALNGAPLAEALGMLIETAVGTIDHGVHAAFYRLSEDGRTLQHVVGMPESYARHIEGVPFDMSVLACGLSVTPDVLEDPGWESWVWLAQEYGYRGCWSFPVETVGGRFVGIFSLYFPEPRTPSQHELGIAEALCGSAAIIIAHCDSEKQRARVTALLTEGEERYRTLFESIDEGFCIIEMLFDDEDRPCDYRFLETNPAFARQTGLADAIGKTIKELVPDHEQHWFDIYGRIARTGEAERFEDAAEALGKWYDVYAFRIGDPGEHRVAVLFRDVYERRRAEQILRQSEDRQHFLLKLSDTLRPLRDAIDIQQTAIRLLGEHLAVNRAGYYEVGPDQNAFFLTARWERDAVPLPAKMLITDFGDEIREGYLAGRTMVACDTEQDAGSESSLAATHAIEVRAWIGVPLVKDGRWFAAVGVHSAVPRNWTPDEIGLVEEVGERTWAAVERAQAEATVRQSVEHQSLLLAELQHRVRNILAVVRSVFSRTAENADTVDDLADHFRGRLDSLARTQVIATQNGNGTVDLENLIRDELLSVGINDSEQRLTLSGPEVELPVAIVEVLSLAIHELTTNSVKYGAIGSPKGSLTITWSLNLDYRTVPRLVLTWLELGVSAMSLDPGRRGFGTELLTEALPYRLGAETHLEFRPGGVRCVIDIPLPPGDGDAASAGLVV